MYYSYVEFEYVAMSFSPARTDLAVKLFNLLAIFLSWKYFSAGKFSNVKKFPADYLRSKKIITINLKPSGTADYFVIPT